MFIGRESEVFLKVFINAKSFQLTHFFCFLQDLRVSQNREGHNILFSIGLRGVENVGFDEEEAEEQAALEPAGSKAESGSEDGEEELPDEYEPSSIACMWWCFRWMH